ncbi:MAG: triosephosphate isomerase [Acidimicrobiales bacterium]|nr:MAG: triosephosphate isomerase [Acidimicrobiales bacterium]
MTVWVGTSWKMNKTLAEAVAFARAIVDPVNRLDESVQPFVIPSFTTARETAEILASTRIEVGAQNMHWADAGAWTGEVSPIMLKDCGLDLVELGHSERREHFGESDHTVGLKTAAAVRHGLVPLICVGETLRQREAGRADEVLTAQVDAALSSLDEEQRAGRIRFAYEPVWAIGEGGTPAPSDYADRQHALIKQVAARVLPAEPPVLYGGSVNPANAVELLAQPHIDGLFVGRAAWAPSDYLEILELAAAVNPGHTDQEVRS